jgi:hypothetical protein
MNKKGNLHLYFHLLHPAVPLRCLPINLVYTYPTLRYHAVTPPLQGTISYTSHKIIDHRNTPRFSLSVLKTKHAFIGNRTTNRRPSSDIFRFAIPAPSLHQFCLCISPSPPSSLPPSVCYGVLILSSKEARTQQSLSLWTLGEEACNATQKGISP